MFKEVLTAAAIASMASTAVIPGAVASCAPKKACNACAAKKACNPCNPCAAKKACNPCNPCATLARQILAQPRKANNRGIDGSGAIGAACEKRVGIIKLIPARFFDLF